MFDTEFIARNYTDGEMHTLLLDVFSNVPASRTPFFVRLMRHLAGHPAADGVVAAGVMRISK